MGEERDERNACVRACVRVCTCDHVRVRHALHLLVFEALKSSKFGTTQ